jgi:tetratricopeptide (TPR) repeat protein
VKVSSSQLHIKYPCSLAGVKTIVRLLDLHAGIVCLRTVTTMQTLAKFISDNHQDTHNAINIENDDENDDDNNDDDDTVRTQVKQVQDRLSKAIHFSRRVVSSIEAAVRCGLNIDQDDNDGDDDTRSSNTNTNTNTTSSSISPSIHIERAPVARGVLFFSACLRCFNGNNQRTDTGSVIGSVIGEGECKARALLAQCISRDATLDLSSVPFYQSFTQSTTRSVVTASSSSPSSSSSIATGNESKTGICSFQIREALFSPSNTFSLFGSVLARKDNSKTSIDAAISAWHQAVEFGLPDAVHAAVNLVHALTRVGCVQDAQTLAQLLLDFLLHESQSANHTAQTPDARISTNPWLYIHPQGTAWHSSAIPTEDHVRTLLAQLHMAQNEWQAAVDVLTPMKTHLSSSSSFKHKPDRALIQGMLALSLIHSRQDNADQAMQLCNDALKLCPNHVSLLLSKAEIALRTNPPLIDDADNALRTAQLVLASIEEYMAVTKHKPQDDVKAGTDDTHTARAAAAEAAGSSTGAVANLETGFSMNANASRDSMKRKASAPPINVHDQRDEHVATARRHKRIRMGVISSAASAADNVSLDAATLLDQGATQASLRLKNAVHYMQHDPMTAPLFDNTELRRSLMVRVAVNLSVICCCKSEQKVSEAAISHLVDALALSPMDRNVNYNMTLLLWRAGRVGEALLHWMAFREISLDMSDNEYSVLIDEACVKAKFPLQHEHTLQGAVTPENMHALDKYVINRWRYVRARQDIQQQLRQLSHQQEQL